ncbi:MAG: DUF3631 domain-containing protein [Mycobacterium sp.]|nr:DUF3631 domain-containing protein [Mycobacterium sp.]
MEDRADELAEWYAEDQLDGAQVLDELRETLTRYVVFMDGHTAAAVTLWIATTHALPAFEHAPRLVLTSPEKRCAKSRTLDVIAGTCHRPLVSINATIAAIYRSLDGEHPPTLIIDEADTIFGSKRVAEANEELRALLNAGHQRGRPALRCVGPNQNPTEFNTFAMAALAGIGTMPDTITDRAVNVTMRRRARDEKVSTFRSRRDGPVLARVRDRLVAWAAENIGELGQAEPVMPVEDRAADTWEPLIAVADVAGGHWPDTARAACVHMVQAADEAAEDRSLSLRLLADARDIFDARPDTAFLSTAELVEALRGVEESPWRDFDMNARRLANRLREYGVKSTRNPAGTQRGYRRDDFTDAFRRYLPTAASDASDTTIEQPKPSDIDIDADVSARRQDNRQTENVCQNEAAVQPALLTHLTLETDTGPVCRYCRAELPAHMRSQIARGYCHRPTCRATATRDGQP